MKTSMTVKALLMIMLCSTMALCQTASIKKTDSNKTTKEMKMYVIERNIPGAGKLTPADLKAISQTSCSVLTEMGPQIEWVHSYVTGDKIFCIYRAENEELLRTHAQKGKFPINNVYPVATIISPETAVQ